MNTILTESVHNSRILIVDDNHRNIQVLANILKEEYNQIEFATDGEGALNWLDDQNFDLLLLDIEMPDIDGYEVCKRIRKDTGFDNLPIIFLSAHNDKKNIRYGFKIGAQDFVSKPFDSGELLMRVRNHLLIKHNIENHRKLKESLEQRVEERTQSLKKAKNEAERSDSLKTIFLQNLSHEIRTPLNGILGFTQIIKENIDDIESTNIYIDIIQNSGERMLALINDLVNISKIESGAPIELNLSTINMIEVIDEVVSIFKQRIIDKGLLLKINISLPEDFMLESDRDKIIQVLSNLLNNAIKFTASGYIEIGSYTDDSNLYMFVKDTGIGILKKFHKVIFDRFFQADARYTKMYEGIGLGLSISKAFIDALGGDIWIDSEENKGATFKLSLPLNK
ncbi:ATP-binding response regulator [Carboxylicivirga linearis]|uniref:histidine kinase n=1 Tax=Carboxylicivirga linearis TaxID=1628157 RepID=A0ABS5JX81_9BACT|nr:hybrid sensor histidine kinase/response regulator [Carboxylicivirga linearis]MBS2099395.1 hybrid sensor histidine kinase/response regulator [Carboxylicivirga linearis]